MCEECMCVRDVMCEEGYNVECVYSDKRNA